MPSYTVYSKVAFILMGSSASIRTLPLSNDDDRNNNVQPAIPSTKELRVDEEKRLPHNNNVASSKDEAILQNIIQAPVGDDSLLPLPVGIKKGSIKIRRKSTVASSVNDSTDPNNNLLNFHRIAIPISKTEEDLLENAETILSQYSRLGNMPFSISETVLNKVLLYHEIDGLRISKNLRDHLIENLLAAHLFDTVQRNTQVVPHTNEDIYWMLRNVKNIIHRRENLLVITDFDAT